MSVPIRVGVVGVGALGQHHARVYSDLPEAELVAVVDPQVDRAREVAARFHCESFRSHEEMIDRVDAVSVAAPTRDHASIGMDFLRQGKHVLLEKPMTQTVREADDLIEIQLGSGRVLQVGHSERFNSALRAIEPLVTRPQFFEAHRLGVFTPRSLDIDVVLDLMIHDLDLILHLVGEPVGEIRAVGIPVVTPQVDIANARLEFENGCVANLTASRVSREKVRKLRFFQPHDYVSIDFDKEQVEMFSLSQEGGAGKVIDRKLEVHPEEPLKLEIQAFLSALRYKMNIKNKN
jgi:predicted dehydrogenase